MSVINKYGDRLGKGGNLQTNAAQLFLFVPIPAKAKKLGLLSIYKFSLHVSFGPASPDAGVELLRQLFLQCRFLPFYKMLFSKLEFSSLIDCFGWISETIKVV